jgi:F-type H+-transporting ATPase subunit a
MASSIIKSILGRLALLLLVALAPISASAQQQPEQQSNPDIITPHITDAHELDLPWFTPNTGFIKVVQLPRWAPVHVGSIALDFSPTKHVVMLILAAFLCCATLLSAARWHEKHENEAGVPRGFSAGIEAMVLYLRQTIVLPNVGPHPDAYTPYILSLFFFILFCNLLGLIPYGSSATGNVSVTGALAIISFIVVEISGIRALGKKYWSTIFYWNHDLALPMRIVLFFIMTPIEIISKLTKPFALTIRLFANMTAGHVVLLVLISLIFTFHSYWVAPAPIALAIGVSFLEIFVAFLQAFVFALLTAVFIGQIREAAH